MSFIWPTMLVLLLLVPLFVVRYYFLQRRRQQVIARFGSLGLMQGGQGRRLSARRHVPPAFFLLALTILIVALARPQAVVSLPKLEGTVILAFDVSGSMAAEDFKPTRMEAAKAAARSFVEHQPLNVQIGVVAFSDGGLSVQPPTNDRTAVLTALNRLAPERGTSVGNGILASLNALIVKTPQGPRMYTNATPAPLPTPTPVPKGTYTAAAIVLLTDGENNQGPNPLAVAQAAIDRGVRIHTVGIGSTAGTTLHINGFTVSTRLNDTMLKQLSELTGGMYFNAETDQDLRDIYSNLNTAAVSKPEKTELTPILAGVSILILLIGGTLSLLWFSRLP